MQDVMHGISSSRLATSLENPLLGNQWLILGTAFSKCLRIMQSPFPLSSRILINLGDPLERKEMADPWINIFL